MGDIMKHSLILLPFFIGSITAWTSCPDLRGIPDFQVLDYTGRWFEYASTSTNYSQGGNDDSCVRALYSDNGDGVIGVFNEAIMPDGVAASVNGSATQPDKQYAELIVSWDFDPAPGTEPNYFVLDTDYTSYSIVWDCKEISEDIHQETIYLLTREQHPTQDLVEMEYLIMADLGLPIDTVEETPQTDCDILPSVQFLNGKFRFDLLI